MRFQCTKLMHQHLSNEEFKFVHQLKYIQNKNTKTQINLVDQSFYLKYEDLRIINKINLNTKNLNKISNFIPKILKKDTIDDQAIFLDFVPFGSLADLIYFREKGINSTLINDFEQVKIIFAYLVICISEIFEQKKLIHSNFTPEHILLTSNMKPLIGGIEYFQPIKNNYNRFFYEESSFSIYTAPEVKKGNPVPESYSYSLSLLIYSILTLSFITNIPNKCPPNMEQSLFSFLVKCFDYQPNKRPKIIDIKREILKLNKDLANLEFEQIYSSENLYGTKDNIVNLIELQWPIAFYIVGSTFLNGNIFDMTSKEATSFLNISKENFSNQNNQNDDKIKKYYEKNEKIYITDIDQQLQKISKMPKMASNISFYNQDPSLVEDQANLSIFNSLNLPNEEFHEYGFYGTQGIIECLKINEQTNFSHDYLFINEPPTNDQSLSNYQSIASSKVTINAMANTFQKRNVNFHSYTQIGALQVATRLFSDLTPNINYEIVLNTGKGIHSTKSDLAKNRNNQPKNPNLEGNGSILGSTLSNAIEKFTGMQPYVGENQGTLIMKINNDQKDNDDDDCYF